MIVAGLLVVRTIVREAGLEYLAMFGFLAMLQGVIQIFDAGLSQLVQKKAAMHIHDRNINFDIDFRVTQLIYRAIGFGFVLIVLNLHIMGVNIVGNNKYHDINNFNEILILILITTGIRFYLSFQKGVLRGFGKHKEISIVNIISTTIRYVFPIPLIVYFKIDALILFVAILIGASIELYLYNNVVRKTGVIKNKDHFSINASQRLAKIKSLFGESKDIAIMSIIWIALSNIDKYTLSKTSSPTDYGYFTLVMNFVSMLIYGITPINTLINARIVDNNKEKKEIRIKNYKYSTYVICIIGSLMASFMIFNVEKITEIWFGINNMDKIDNLLLPYIMGNLLIIITSISYTYMMAENNLSDHMRYSLYQLVAMCLILPIAYNFDMEWVAIFWLVVHLIYFLFAYSRIAKKITGNHHSSYILIGFISLSFLWGLIASSINLDLKLDFLNLLIIAFVNFAPLIYIFIKIGSRLKF
jgi:O-antigen/teichoic acid export membrane protein